ncbi:MAG: hypothetical protein HY782_21240 [Chloroflexi bacterium]|nr:hypothetical protein [Chloroflexota bacterium]
MTFLYPLLVVLLAVFAVAPLEYPGAFQSHTGLLAVYNLINLDQDPLQSFNWAPTVGRTFDLFRTDGGLPYRVAELFHLVGFGYLDSIKLVYAFAWIASGLTMYALARRFFSEPGALLAATVYVYLPYHLATIYVRGAFAESVAWALFPLALWAVVSSQPPVASRKRFAFQLLPFAFLFFTQPGLAILFTIVTLALVAAFRWRVGSLAHRGDLGHWVIGSLAPALGGLALGMLLYTPSVLRYGFQAARDGFAPNFVLPFQLFSSLWGYGPSTGSFPPQGLAVDQFPLQLGVVPLGLSIIAVALAWQNKLPHPHTPTRTLAIALAIAILLTLLTFEITAPLWSVLRVFVAYPWQLLAFVGVALALAAGAAVEFDARLKAPAMLAVFVALPVIAVYGYLSPRWLDFTPTRPQIAIFGNNEIALLDYRIVGPLRHGATIRVEMQWQALRQVDHDYTVFVHAVNEDGKTYGSEDSKPQDGALPTIKWTPGQVVSDTHTIQIDVDGPREDYLLEIGLYQSANGNRAILDNGADYLMLPRPGDPEPYVPTRK